MFCSLSAFPSLSYFWNRIVCSDLNKEDANDGLALQVEGIYTGDVLEVQVSPFSVFICLLVSHI